MGQSPRGKHCTEDSCRLRSTRGWASPFLGTVWDLLANERIAWLATCFVDEADTETASSHSAHAYTMLDTGGLLLLARLQIAIVLFCETLTLYVLDNLSVARRQLGRSYSAS